MSNSVELIATFAIAMICIVFITVVARKQRTQKNPPRFHGQPK